MVLSRARRTRQIVIQSSRRRYGAVGYSGMARSGLSHTPASNTHSGMSLQRRLCVSRFRDPKQFALLLQEAHNFATYWRATMQRLLRVILLVSLALMPATVFAQASIVGTVRDASGAVVPGVTVEASSPALIEKFRSVVSNSTGQYAIEDLRPGT